MEALFFHPKLVHIPIALGALMPLIAGGLLIAWWRNWLPARAWAIAVGLQLVLVLGGVLALRTGNAEEERVERVVPEALIEQHEEAAEAFVSTSAVVLALMLLASAFRNRPLALPLAAAASVGTLAVFGLGYKTGHAGGDLVYGHGAAQVYANAAGALPTGEAGGGEEAEKDGDDD